MPQGTILVADDDAAIRTVLSQALGRAGYEVRTTGQAGTLYRWAAAGEGDLIITDVVMPDENGFDLVPRIKKVRPDVPIIVMSAQNTFMTAIRASERGAYEYLPKPFDLKELIAIVGRAMSRPKSAVHEDPDHPDDIPLVGRSPAMQELYRALARLMQTDLTVMIMGESGTGKELVARALHDYGKRRRGPFVPVNMAAIPRDLIESELFGHENRRYADGCPDTSVAGVAAGRIYDCGRAHADQNQCADCRGHQQGFARSDPARPVPRGFVFPTECGSVAPAALARAERGYPRSGQAFLHHRRKGRPAAQTD